MAITQTLPHFISHVSDGVYGGMLHLTELAEGLNQIKNPLKMHQRSWQTRLTNRINSQTSLCHPH